MRLIDRKQEGMLAAGMNVYQDAAREFSLLEDSNRLEYGLLNMASEVGEILGNHAKSVRDQVPINKLDQIDELGDLLWSMSCYADALDVSLGDIARRNLEKLEDRRERDVINGSGDHR